MHLIRRRRIVSLLKILIHQNVRRTAPFRQSRQSPAPVKGRRQIGRRLLNSIIMIKILMAFFVKKGVIFFHAKLVF
jgi:hypothetical protein